MTYCLLQTHISSTSFSISSAKKLAHFKICFHHIRIDVIRCRIYVKRELAIHICVKHVEQWWVIRIDPLKFLSCMLSFRILDRNFVHGVCQWKSPSHSLYARERPLYRDTMVSTYVIGYGG